MKIIIWNCQGAKPKEFLQAAKNLIKTHRPMIFGLLETKMSGDGTDKICNNLGFDNWVRIEVVGFSGAIWVLWKEEVEVDISFSYPQFILLNITEARQRKWSLAVVYASPIQSLMRKLWDTLKANVLNINLLWVAISDFNSIVRVEETSNQNTFSNTRCAGLTWGSLAPSLRG